MKITANEIKHIAHLARLELDKAEVETMTTQLGTILDYITTLNELDTQGIPATTHTTAMENAFREDFNTPSLSQEEALANGPCRNDEAFVVPRII